MSSGEGAIAASDGRAAAMARLAAEGASCTRCPLFETGTPVVWGEGDPNAAVMLIGQGPGEQESRLKRPFVGPAGALLDRALVEAGIDRGRLWLTNAIKHWATTVNPRGTVVNREPRANEIRACAVWLEGELAIVRPRVIVCIGGPAAHAVIDRRLKITRARGQWFPGPHGAEATVTLHPSYLLRLRSASPAAYAEAWPLLIGDLRAVVERAAGHGADLAPSQAGG